MSTVTRTLRVEPFAVHVCIVRSRNLLKVRGNRLRASINNDKGKSKKKELFKK